MRVNLTFGTPEQARDLAGWAAQWGVGYLDGAAMSGTRFVGQPEALLLYSGSLSRAVALREFRRVARVVPGTIQAPCEPNRKLSVDEELHAAPSGTTRPPPAASAPNSNAASRSSLSRSG